MLNWMLYVALASFCGAAVCFMLLFLRALLREVVGRRPRRQLIGRRKMARATPISIEQSSTHGDRASWPPIVLGGEFFARPRFRLPILFGLRRPPHGFPATSTNVEIDFDIFRHT